MILSMLFFGSRSGTKNFEFAQKSGSSSSSGFLVLSFEFSGFCVLWVAAFFARFAHFLDFMSRISWISCRAFPGVSCCAFPGVSCFMSCEFSFSFSSNANWHRLKISDSTVKLKKNICHSRISRIQSEDSL